VKIVPPLFPFDLFGIDRFEKNGGELGRRIAALSHLCLHPPYPWGHWLYGHLLEERMGSSKANFVECGVAFGGTALFLGEYARRSGRIVYALDTFSGLPAPNPLHDNPYFREGDYSSHDGISDLFAQFSDAIKCFNLSGIVRPVKGLLRDTLPNLPENESYAFTHIDLDLHDSVLQALTVLFPRTIEGGALVIDDFFHPSQGSARATEIYFRSIDYAPVYHVSFPYSVVLIKGEKPGDCLKRAIDGNFYSVDYLRRDPLLRNAVSTSLANAIQCQAEREAAHAGRFLELLSPSRTDSSKDIYEYWCALQDYWVAIDKGSRDPRMRTSPKTLRVNVGEHRLLAWRASNRQPKQ
jgi:Macrocin-O-methyltransferase (TylF)